MAKNRMRSGLGDFLDIMTSAIAVAAATRDYRTPRSSDLKALGIDPEQFGKINRF